MSELPMSNFDEPSRSRAVSRLALLALMSAGVAGCSSDFSRMSENPWSSKPQAPYKGGAGSNETTGSIHQPAPSHKVESSALPPPAPAQQATYGGGAGLGSYQPPQQVAAAPPPPHAPRAEYTGS